MNVRRFTPSMSLMLAFEAAARHGSFTRAAQELNLSQSAVSRQVQTLESQLQAQLFERHGRQVVLTPAGAAYARDLHAALARIREASLRVYEARADARRLRLAILPILGSKWLMPRLSRFQEQYPDIAVDLHSRPGDFDLAASGLDASITVGDGHWPGLVAHHLFDSPTVVVASPPYLARHPIRRASDLLDASLLHITSYSSGWRESLADCGIDPRRVKLGAQYEYTAHLIQALRSGMGIGMMPAIFVKDELRRGTLVTLQIPKLRSRVRHYYLLYPQARADTPAIQAFCKWILGQAARERRAPSPLS